MGGVPYRRIVDRRAAIRAALDEAASGDTILLAGKGHETYQVIGTRTCRSTSARSCWPRRGPGHDAVGPLDVGASARCAWAAGDRASGANRREAANGVDEPAFTRVLTDTRAIEPGALFVALVGERFDGHDYLDAASRRERPAVVVREGARVPPA